LGLFSVGRLPFLYKVRLMAILVQYLQNEGRIMGKEMRQGYSFIIKICVFSCILVGVSSAVALAQYDDIRYPRKPEELELFKKNRVMGETQWSIENDKKLPYMTSVFDTGGRVVIAQDYHHIKYYSYDAKGNVTVFLDSARKDTGYTVSEYKFRYSENGMLLGVDGPGFKSGFVYDPGKRKLTETMVKDDTTRKNVFLYDKNNRLKEAFFYAPDHSRTAHFLKNYGQDGRLYNECQVQLGKNYRDSTLSINEYGDKKQLVKKQVFRFLEFKYNSTGSGQPNRSVSHDGIATYEYSLDSLGRPIAEEYSVKDDKLSYSYSTWTYDNKGLVTKNTYLFGHGEPKVTEHEYYYYK